MFLIAVRFIDFINTTVIPVSDFTGQCHWHAWDVDLVKHSQYKHKHAYPYTYINKHNSVTITIQAHMGTAADGVIQHPVEF